MPATFNEFQRELNKLEFDPKIKYILTMLYERFGQVLREHEEMTKIMLDFANQLEGFVNLSKEDRKRMVAIGQKLGIVKSVANDPTEE